ncbi:hypothetical protein TELCIR_23700 [Teladorsagia circumcincta]|uniref:Uncharacterized protein n=1 Tax=Teladorsagia circumcincta TaxID=45464 RepID=A0A2G9TAG2_TELCI|nr:hypothetical protein TELCIR_23700 [Teladorsagia circumcincta]
MRRKGGSLVTLLKRKILSMLISKRNGGDLIAAMVLKGRNITKNLPVIGNMMKRKESPRVRVAASDTMTNMESERKELGESEIGAWIGGTGIKVIGRKIKAETGVGKEMYIKARTTAANEREMIRIEKKILLFGNAKKTANEKRL